jgi:regulator of sigma D
MQFSIDVDIDENELFNAIEGDVQNLIEQNDDVTDGLLNALQEYLNQDQALCDLGQAFEAAVRKAVSNVFKGE